MVSRSVGWFVLPLTLVASLLLTQVVGGRAWVGDWAYGLGWSSVPVIFMSMLLAAVAAYDAGSALTGERASAWDSLPRPGRDVVLLWCGAWAPFAVAQALTVLSVGAVLIASHASVGSVAPLAQQAAVLAVSAALGCLCGALLGPRLGSFTALVTSAYLTYGLCYLHGRAVPPLTVDLPSWSMIGLELNPRRVATQCLIAAVWAVAPLALVATSRATPRGHRRATRAVITLGVTGVLLTYLIGPAAERLPELVSVSVPRRCLEASGPSGRPRRICLLRGHDRALRPLAERVTRYAHAVHVAGIDDVVPPSLDEAVSGSASGYGTVVFGDGDTATSIGRGTVAQALIGGANCPALAAPDLVPSATFDRYLALEVVAEQTVSDILDGRPASQWSMAPQQFRAFVLGSADCDLARAVGAW
jgi:hypothetical protein